MLDIILNGKAGNGKALNEKNKIEKLLNEKNVEHRFHFTSGRKDATKITRELCLNGATDVIAMGGDGTANEVLNGLTNLENVRFGIIPCGSGNDFADTVKIPLKPEKALEIILNETAKPTDFLVCDGVRGLNVIGTGIDVEILERTEKNKVLKGKIKYMVSLIISLIKFKFYNFKLKFAGNYEALPNDNANEKAEDMGKTEAAVADPDGNPVASEKEAPDRSALIVCCGNGRKIGGGIPICPEAIVDDGKMDFLIINRMKKSRIPHALVKLMKGKILTESFSEFKRVDKATLFFEKTPAIQIDGEIYYDLNFDVHIEKGKLNLYRPDAAATTTK